MLATTEYNDANVPTAWLPAIYMGISNWTSMTDDIITSNTMKALTSPIKAMGGSYCVVIKIILESSQECEKKLYMHNVNYTTASYVFGFITYEEINSFIM